MEHLIPLEIWAVLVAAPCMIAWFLGDMYGAARMRRMIEAGDLIDASGLVQTSPTKAKIPLARASQTGPFSLDASEEAPLPSNRGDTFVDMPSLAELHAHAERIRATGKVWDDQSGIDPVSADPVSARILQHYRGSINELGRHNALAEEPNRPPFGAGAWKSADGKS